MSARLVRILATGVLSACWLSPSLRGAEGSHFLAERVELLDLYSQLPPAEVPEEQILSWLAEENRRLLDPQQNPLKGPSQQTYRSYYARLLEVTLKLEISRTLPLLLGTPLDAGFLEPEALLARLDDLSLLLPFLSQERGISTQGALRLLLRLLAGGSELPEPLRESFSRALVPLLSSPSPELRLLTLSPLVLLLGPQAAPFLQNLAREDPYALWIEGRLRYPVREEAQRLLKSEGPLPPPR